MIQVLFIIGFAAFCGTYLLVPVSKKIATRLGAIDKPSARRVHSVPTTRMGGIAICGGMGLALLVAYAVQYLGILQDRIFSSEINYDILFAAVLVIFLVGAIDDVKQLRARTKLFGQIIAALIAVFAGVLLTDIHSGSADIVIEFGFWAYPITIFYLVAFANIINLIDGLDGLAAGVAAICGAAFLILSYQLGLWATAAMATALVLSCIAFLRFNFNPAQLFMGDCGSQTLGFLLGVISLIGTMRVSSITALAVPVVIAAIPVLDTLAAIIRRKRSHVSIGSPDKGHLHHTLLKLGFSQRRVVLVIYGICAVFAASGVIISGSDLNVRIVVVIVDLVLATILVWKLGLFGKVMGRYYPDGLPRNFLKKRNKKSSVERKKTDSNEKTKILFVTQHYWPEPFNSTDICEELVKRGYEVTVLTGQPNYPEGFIYPGYENCAITREERNGVVILRSKLHPRKTGVLHRVWNYYSFSWNASVLARDLPEGFDVVYSYQTSPVMMANPAITYAKKTGTPLFFHCIDIWPECLTVWGIKPGSPIYNYFRTVSRNIYSSADRLAITSEMFADYIRDTVGVQINDALYLPQYAEDIFESEPANVSGICEKDFPPDKINIMFAGNVGAAQSVDTAIRAAALLKDEPFIFHIVGSGSELETCEDLANGFGVTNVVFHGRHPIEEMPAYYAKADVMLATFESSPILAYTLPRKIQSYMAARKPIIGTVLGASRRVINEAQCGFCCDAEDYVGLANACRKFAACDSHERMQMGDQGRAYYEAHFSKNGFFEILDKELNELKGTEHHGC